MEKFCSEIVRRGVHQVVAAAGYDKSSRISCDILTDVYKEYLMALGRSAQENANNVGRSLVNVNDILQAFNEYKVNVNELKEWTGNDGKALNGYSGVIPNVLKDAIKDDRCESDKNLIVAVNATMNEERSNEDIDMNGEEEAIEDDVMEIEENNITYENTDINDRNGKKNNNNIDHLHSRPNYIPEWLPPLPNIELIKKVLMKSKALKSKPKKIIHETEVKEHSDKQIEIKPKVATSPPPLQSPSPPSPTPPTPSSSSLQENLHGLTMTEKQSSEIANNGSNNEPSKKRIKLKGGMNPDYVIQAFHSLQDQYKFSHSSLDSNQTSKHSLNDDSVPTNSSKRIKLFKQDAKSTKKAKSITVPSGINMVAAQSTAPVVKIKSNEKKAEDKTPQPLVKTPVAAPIKIKLKLPNPPIIATASSSSSSAAVPAVPATPTTKDSAPTPAPTLTSAVPTSTEPLQNAYEENYDQEVVHCICEPPNCFLDDGKFMLSCDHCQVWFHGTCTGFGPMSVEVGTWYCKRCVAKGVAEI